MNERKNKSDSSLPRGWVSGHVVVNHMNRWERATNKTHLVPLTF